MNIQTKTVTFLQTLGPENGYRTEQNCEDGVSDLWFGIGSLCHEHLLLFLSVWMNLVSMITEEDSGSLSVSKCIGLAYF